MTAPLGLDITLPTAALAARLGELVRLLPGRLTDPVLGGVVVVATPAGVRVASSDHERGFQADLDGLVGSEGSVLVPARPLAETLRSLSDPEVRLVVEGSRLAVRAGRARFALPLMDLAAHPGVAPAPPHRLSVPSAALRGPLAVVAAAASRDDALPVFTGVRISTAGGVLALLASDRFRLAKAEIPLPAARHDAAGLDVLVPAALLAELARQLPRSGEVTLRADADRFALSWEGTLVTTAVLATPFPNSDRLFPSDVDSVLRVDADALSAAVRRAATFGGGRGLLTLVAEDGGVRVLGSDPAVGESEETVKADVTGNRSSRTYQARHLVDALRGFVGRVVELRVPAHERRGAVLTAEPDRDGVRVTHLVAPTRPPAPRD
ncbi:DNA polymerase III subunit beta [Actinoalloteichus spitiensis]|uniref:DNA polymerase III subunit beta n=1 Tax=Actinoalloteichus spitiensis TaxID=252394 RepID=UPI0003814BC5|nr:DNA polymerase III subunit beta [Actinoalloteichus spitiensis]